MKVLRMTTDQLTTDARIADALLEYAKLLGRAEDTDSVVLPIVRDGRVEEASILLGPASQITLTETHDAIDTAVRIPGMEQVLEDLARRIDRVSGEHPIAHDEEVPAAEAFPDFDAL